MRRLALQPPEVEVFAVWKDIGLMSEYKKIFLNSEEMDVREINDRHTELLALND